MKPLLKNSMISQKKKEKKKYLSMKMNSTPSKKTMIISKVGMMKMNSRKNNNLKLRKNLPEILVKKPNPCLKKTFLKIWNNKKNPKIYLKMSKTSKMKSKKSRMKLV